jgi:hypothetical protein
MAGLVAAGIALAAFAGLGRAQQPATTTPQQAEPQKTEPQQAAASPAAQHMAALQASLKKDAAALRQYEWIETTVMLMKGEEKSRSSNRCYYGADGKLQKIAVGEATATEEGGRKHGIKHRKTESKKSEISDYMSKSVDAITHYIPPDPAKLQALQAGGKVAVEVLEPNKRVRLDFKDYYVPGDVLGVELDVVGNKLLGINVSTMIEGAKEPITFQTVFGSLQDGTGYPSKITLDAKEEGVTVNIENTGYKKSSSS